MKKKFRKELRDALLVFYSVLQEVDRIHNIGIIERIVRHPRFPAHYREILLALKFDNKTNLTESDIEKQEPFA